VRVEVQCETVEYFFRCSWNLKEVVDRRIWKDLGNLYVEALC
jgi:hypothetical protein